MSDIFIAAGSELPPAMSAIGWTFPLRHVTAVTAASGGVLNAVWWGHLGLVLLWVGISAVGAQLLFRWEPRHDRRARPGKVDRRARRRVSRAVAAAAFVMTRRR